MKILNISTSLPVFLWWWLALPSPGGCWPCWFLALFSWGLCFGNVLLGVGVGRAFSEVEVGPAFSVCGGWPFLFRAVFGPPFRALPSTCPNVKNFKKTKKIKKENKKTNRNKKIKKILEKKRKNRKKKKNVKKRKRKTEEK